jgi:predicted RNase H-like HicB family nuclease
MASYTFRVELDVDDHGRWAAVVPALPGCGAVGYTADEALEAIREEARGYVQALLRARQDVPVDESAGIEDALTVEVSV